MAKITFLATEISGCDHFFSDQNHFVVSGLDIFSVVDTNLFEAKITFVMADITFKIAVITSPVTKITFEVAEIDCKVALITSSVANITFVVAEITFKVVVIIYSVIKITFVVV